MFRVIVLVAVLLFNVHAFAQDSSHVNSSNSAQADTTINAQPPVSSVEDDEFNIFLLVIGTAAVCFMTGFFVLGICFFLLLLVMTFALVAIGLISTSVVAGLYKKSLTTGFKTFFLLAGSIGGLVAGVTSFGIVVLLLNLPLDSSTVTIAGSTIGTISGALLGWSAFIILRKALRFLATKYKALVNPTAE